MFGFSADGEGAAELALLADYAPIPPSLGFAEAAGVPAAIETAARTLAGGGTSPARCEAGEQAARPSLGSDRDHGDRGTVGG